VNTLTSNGMAALQADVIGAPVNKSVLIALALRPLLIASPHQEET